MQSQVFGKKADFGVSTVVNKFDYDYLSREFELFQLLHIHQWPGANYTAAIDNKIIVQIYL